HPGRPRHGIDGAIRRPARHHVCRPTCRGGADRRHHRAAAPSLYARPDRRAAVARGARHARRHPRPRALLARIAIGLRLPPALRAGDGSLPRRTPRVARHRRGAGRLSPGMMRFTWHDAMPPLIEAVEVSKRFGGGLGREGALALAGLSLAIGAERPSVIRVVGESGSGKTTLARLLLGLVEPSEGMVRYRGQDLRRLGFEARRTFRRDVQAIFQDPYGVYKPFLRVDHVLTVPLRRYS